MGSSSNVCWTLSISLLSEDRQLVLEGIRIRYYWRRYQRSNVFILCSFKSRDSNPEFLEERKRSSNQFGYNDRLDTVTI